MMIRGRQLRARHKEEEEEEEEERAGHKNPRRPNKVTHAHVQGFSYRQGAHMAPPVALQAPHRAIVSRKGDTMDSMGCAWENHAQ